MKLSEKRSRLGHLTGKAQIAVAFPVFFFAKAEQFFQLMPTIVPVFPENSPGIPLLNFDIASFFTCDQIPTNNQQLITV